MKKMTKIISLLLTVIMLVMAIPVTAFAAKGEVYIKEIRMSTASTADAAKKYLTDEGYTVVNVDLNQRSGKGCVYIGYKTTTNPDEAITDIALMQMDGGYSFSEYEALLELKMQEISDMLDFISVCLTEARTNYAAGMPNAVGACEILNFFKEDDSGKLLGDFLLTQEPSREDIIKIFLQGNGNIATIIYNMLAFACTDNGEDTNWLAKLSKVDIWGDYDPLIYSDAANALVDSFVNIHDMMVTYETKYMGIAEEIINNPEYAGYSDEEIQDLLPDSYGEYSVIYETLSNYKYGGKPLLDFFMQDPNELDTDDLYPIVSAMSLGQQQIVKFVGLSTLIAFAESDGDASQTFIKSMKDSCALFSDEAEKVSVYYGVDRSLFEDGGVALTTASLRKSASTGDNSWFSGDNIDPILSTSLHIVAGSCVTLAIGAAVGARWASKAAPKVYQTVLRTEMCKFPTQQIAALQAERAAEMAKLATQYEKTSQAYYKASQQISSKYSRLMTPYATGEYAEVLAKEASTKLTRLGVSLNIVMGVAMGLALIAEGINMGIRVYNYYNDREYSEIPRAIVDEVLTNTDSYYVNYYAVKDQTGNSGDLNAWGGYKWNALYTTTDKRAGDPIIASSLEVKLKNNSFPSDDHGAVHYFGESAAADVNRYHARSSTATFIFYKRDHSLSMTASTFSGGQLVMFTGFGLIGGVAIGSFGVIGAGKLKNKKKNEENTESDENTDSAA